MKKLIIKDSKKIKAVLTRERGKYILFSICNNANFFASIRRNANKRLQHLILKHSITAINNRCKQTINKKKLNKLTTYSRHIFLKLIRFGKIHGFQKSSW